MGVCMGCTGGTVRGHGCVGDAQGGTRRVWGLHKGVHRGEGVCTGRVQGVHGAVKGGAQGVVGMLRGARGCRVCSGAKEVCPGSGQGVLGCSGVQGGAHRSAVPSKARVQCRIRTLGLGCRTQLMVLRGCSPNQPSLSPPPFSRLPKQSWAARAGLELELKYKKDHHPQTAAGEIPRCWHPDPGASQGQHTGSRAPGHEPLRGGGFNQRKIKQS